MTTPSPTRRLASQTKGRHGQLVNACIELIQARGGVAWKNASAKVLIPGVKPRMVTTGKKGLPDVVGVMRAGYTAKAVGVGAFVSEWQPVGRMVCVEVKVGKDPLSPAQIDMHARLVKAGALVLTVRDIRELADALA